MKFSNKCQIEVCICIRIIINYKWNFKSGFCCKDLHVIHSFTFPHALVWTVKFDCWHLPWPVEYCTTVAWFSAARLMHKYNAHGATDVTGFGLLGHAQNLARHQKNEVSFVIHNLPVIAKMAAVAKACGNMFQLLQGHSAETSGEQNDCRVWMSVWNCALYEWIF